MACPMSSGYPMPPQGPRARPAAPRPGQLSSSARASLTSLRGCSESPAKGAIVSRTVTWNSSMDPPSVSTSYNNASDSDEGNDVAFPKDFEKEEQDDVVMGRAATWTKTPNVEDAASDVELQKTDDGVMGRASSWATTPNVDEDSVSVPEQPKTEIDPSELIMEEIIAKGSATDIYRADFNGEIVAVKRYRRVRRMSLKQQIASCREIEAFMNVRHPNLVRFVGACMLSAPFQIVTELCEGGNLYEFLHEDFHIEVSWKQKAKIALDISEGMAFLHGCSPQIIHRDLTSLNCLLAQPITGQKDKVHVKVGNFGFAKVKSEADSWTNMTSDVGTLVWKAPEILRRDNYDEKVDVYAFGIVLFEIITRSPPFEDLDECSFEDTISSGGRPELTALPHDCPKEFKDIMESCWTQDPEERPDFSTVRQTLRCFDF